MDQSLGAHKFHDAIEIREDAGTPAIIQGIRVALALEVKEAMNTRRIQERKAILLHRALEGLEAIPGVTVLEAGQRERQGIISFTIKDVHYGLAVTLLSDLFGIQTRGGCSCAGTYGHYLFGIDQPTSKRITAAIDSGDHSAKPGWVRISLHPTMTDHELEQVLYALNQIVTKIDQFRSYYKYETATNSWRLRDDLKLRG